METLLRRNPWLQFALLVAFWLLCDRAARAWSLPIPGGIFALLLLLLLLLTRRIPLEWVREGASGLLDHMVLFFVPAIMALLGHRELLGVLGLKLLLVITLGTLMVMVGTALAVEFCFRWRERHGL